MAEKLGKQRSEYMTICHEFPPVYDQNSRVLILGSLPSVKSRETKFYYGNPKNRFFSVLARVFSCKIPETIEEKKNFLLSHRIALWDVIRKCEIKGSSDSSIRNVEANDITKVLSAAKIQHIYANGTKAEELYYKFCYVKTGIDIHRLPSTSPANASCSIEKLVEAWRVVSEEPQKEYHYYQFHKPGGCVTALRDEKNETIVKYLNGVDLSKVRPVGRLDKDTEGLLILTDDGIFNQKMTHPDNRVEKEYFFYAIGEYTEEKRRLLLNGIDLKKKTNEAKETDAKDEQERPSEKRPAALHLKKKMTLRSLPVDIMEKLESKTKRNRPETPVFCGYLTVTEGKKHEVRRLLRQIGTYCIYLKRIRMGTVTLFPDLAPGEVREFRLRDGNTFLDVSGDICQKNLTGEKDEEG